ncbi:MAG: SH3 domain-containing protein [Schleiferiaceae bacterium]|nr:SH3 domain-containing protein [Schleiferiaceae bacterium]
MRIWLTSLVSLLVLLSAQAQNCTPDIPASVAASSGIKLRGGPGTNFPVVAYIPKDSVVVMCSSRDKAASFEGIDGFWRVMLYRDKRGYAFDGFVKEVMPLSQENTLPSAPEERMIADSSAIASKKTPQPTTVVPKQRLEYQLLTEVYNFCGDISSIDPGLAWYAIYQIEDEFFFKRREIQVLKSKYSLASSMEFDIRTESAEKSAHFLIGFPVVQPFDTVKPIVFHSHEFHGKLPKKIFPGMQLGLYGKEPGFNEGNVILSAIGNVKDIGICPDLEGYQLRITTEKNGQPIQQNLNRLFVDLGQCGIPELFWFGDINGDGYPEMIFVTTRPEFTTFSLFTSDTVVSDAIYRRATTWTIDSCE